MSLAETFTINYNVRLQNCCLTFCLTRSSSCSSNADVTRCIGMQRTEVRQKVLHHFGECIRRLQGRGRRHLLYATTYKWHRTRTVWQHQIEFTFTERQNVFFHWKDFRLYTHKQKKVPSFFLNPDWSLLSLPDWSEQITLFTLPPYRFAHVLQKKLPSSSACIFHHKTFRIVLKRREEKT